MARTTDIQVRSVHPEIPAAFNLDAAILTANELVTEVCVPLTYSDARLELIERWLAAHFAAISIGTSASEGAGSVNQAFQFRLGLNLAVTMWGQQALLLDTLGGLAGLNKATEEGKRRRVGMFGPSPPVEDCCDGSGSSYYSGSGY